MEKMLRLIHASRLVFAFAFIVSAWRDYDDERTWLVFNLNGEEAAQEYIILGIVMKAKYIIGLGIVMKLYGGISFLSSTCPGALILLIYQAILSPVLYDLYNRVCEELGLSNARHRKFCDQISEYVNETLLADNGVRMAMCHHDSIDQEEQSQKFCDLINEGLNNSCFGVFHYDKT
ncbi:HR-like lesion-inducing protein-related [Raphanus sativus]|nr:HR-like lesion-inducing protein-related [Raphanus sativus]